MTTAQSPIGDLKAQADEIATALKAAERGENIAHDPGGKIAAARAKDSITVGVVMDDKVIKLEIAWAMIRNTSEAGISAYIIEQMRGTTEPVH